MQPAARQSPGLRLILDLHDSHRPPGSLDLCLADGYLIHTNSIYRNVRAAALELGCQYTTEDFCHYEALKLVSLSKMLAERKIPYCDNVTVLRELEAARPRQFSFSEIFDLRKNYLLHESAHLVADGCLKKRAEADARGKVLELNLIESFANTSELLARLEIATELDDQIFNVNSYIDGRPKIAPTFAELRQHLAPGALFKIYLLTYLHSNFLYDGLTPARLAEVLKVVDPKQVHRAPVLELLQAGLMACFRLSRPFRTKTQAFYLKFLGIEGPLPELLNFDFLKVLRESPDLMAFVEKLAEVACRVGRNA